MPWGIRPHLTSYTVRTAEDEGWSEIPGNFPHELSGEQLQRVSIMRASSLSGANGGRGGGFDRRRLRMSIVNLFRCLRDDLRVPIVYITYHLATTYYISERIIIMRKRVVVEAGDARTVLDAPADAYAVALRNAVLPPDSAAAAMIGSA